MFIVISPSKTMDYTKTAYLEDKPLLFPKKHQGILAELEKLKKSDIAKAFQIKGDLIENTYQNIKNYLSNPMAQAFPSYTGLVFKNLNKKTYREKEYDYITKHLRILDAFYGVLEPGSLIKPYRLDMKSKIGVNLYEYWDLNPYFENQIVINLASTEFSKMIHRDMIQINFFQEVEGSYKNQATYSKQARGMFLDYMIKNHIEDIELLKRFSRDNYRYNQELSDAWNLSFTRNLSINHPSLG